MPVALVNNKMHLIQIFLSSMLSLMALSLAQPAHHGTLFIQPPYPNKTLHTNHLLDWNANSSWFPRVTDIQQTITPGGWFEVLMGSFASLIPDFILANVIDYSNGTMGVSWFHPEDSTRREDLVQKRPWQDQQPAGYWVSAVYDALGISALEDSTATALYLQSTMYGLIGGAEKNIDCEYVSSWFQTNTTVTTPIIAIQSTKTINLTLAVVEITYNGNNTLVTYLTTGATGIFMATTDFTGWVNNCCSWLQVYSGGSHPANTMPWSSKF